MPREPEKGTPALYKYQSVQYFHFEVPPGTAYVLTADPWSFLQAWIIQKIPKKRSKNRECFTRAKYYSQLAANFYKAADATEFPIKATLTYYGMLNLVKCFLSIRGIELESTLEHHGLTLPLGKKQLIQINNSSHGISIFSEFAKLLNKPISGQHDLSVKDLICHIPELHEMAHSLGQLPWSRRKFLPVEIGFLVNSRKDKLFTEIKYEKKQETRVDTSKFYKETRKDYFHDQRENNGWLIYRSKNKKPVNQNNFPTIYRNIQKDYTEFALASLLTRSGYRYYCDLKPGCYHHLSFSLALLFYLGSVARYRPTEVEDLLISELSPLVSEAIAVVPKQFLYQLLSFITGNVCVIPQSKL
ncbi:YaaC family protein [Chroococcidiopsis sp.]|uniref:YaaC family protein n=1 Tax=Chroococcidiopsis sp. TaxID=3088168 RepID=UPI003F3ED521